MMDFLEVSQLVTGWIY